SLYLLSVDPALKFVRRSDPARHCRCCSDGRACKVDFALRMAHPSDEIPVGGGDSPFTFGKYAHVTAEARSACRRAYCCAGLYEYVEEAFIHSLLPYLLCSRDYDAAHVRMNSAAFQHLRRHPHILYPSIGTRSYDHLVYLDVAYLVDRPRIARQMRERHGRCHRAQVDEVFAAVSRIVISLIYFIGFRGMFLHVLDGLFVNVEDAVLGTGFDGHVGH